MGALGFWGLGEEEALRALGTLDGALRAPALVALALARLAPVRQALAKTRGSLELTPQIPLESF